MSASSSGAYSREEFLRRRAVFDRAEVETFHSSLEPPLLIGGWEVGDSDSVVEVESSEEEPVPEVAIAAPQL